jgi:acyl-CoA synthetase (AMP-forming)/AMP-acid ligase II
MIGQQAKIVDKSGAEVGPGERGELLLAGDVVFAGYWRNERASRDALVDGWLYTGDIAVRDEEGYYWIVDRAKDMIISGGINVYPAEVEAVLREHPDVDEIAVVGVADEEWGESPAACVVTDNKALTLDELNDFARDRLARYKRPTRLVFVDGGLPRGMSGKVLKRDLREMLSSSTTRGGS